MKLYDETIRKVQGLLSGENETAPGTGGQRELAEKRSGDGSRNVRKLPHDVTGWPSVSDRSMILRSDMAYELGGGSLPALGVTLVTASKELVPGDGVYLIGPDLPEITVDTPFARIALVRVGEDTLGEGRKLYRAIRNLEYTRYHFYPEGFMLRVSASKRRESVRIGREALKKGLDFAKTGSQMITDFHTHPEVEAVEIYYVTAKDFPYKELDMLSRESEKITGTLDHMMQNLVMDCGVCGLKQVCDEVEGLRELHFHEAREN